MHYETYRRMAGMDSGNWETTRDAGPRYRVIKYVRYTLKSNSMPEWCLWVEIHSHRHVNAWLD